ncbi:30S ribosomal protein S3ae [Candidatus Micrarchaeota archaeon]|nr:30S ribosomal protein S3ae [Candidatus Micrarchaeota archaeon]MBU1930346.1 30S ribosomal protein S3ae [Candidatus Micrarchaeota archaeon]
MPAMIEEKTETKEKKPKRSVKRKTVDKWKRKKWFSIIAPDFFNREPLGETVSEEEEKVLNRTIVANAGELSRQSKLRHIQLKFSIHKTQGQKAFTQFKGHEIQDSYLKRLARRRSSKIQVVEELTIKTGEKVRVKAVTITSRKAAQIQKTQIRKIMKKELEDAAGKKTFEQFIQEIIFGTISSNIFKSAKKIVPIKRVEINKSLVLRQKAT